MWGDLHPAGGPAHTQHSMKVTSPSGTCTLCLKVTCADNWCCFVCAAGKAGAPTAVSSRQGPRAVLGAAVAPAAGAPANIASWPGSKAYSVDRVPAHVNKDGTIPTKCSPAMQRIVVSITYQARCGHCCHAQQHVCHAGSALLHTDWLPQLCSCTCFRQRKALCASAVCVSCQQLSCARYPYAS